MYSFWFCPDPLLLRLGAVAGGRPHRACGHCRSSTGQGGASAPAELSIRCDCAEKVEYHNFSQPSFVKVMVQLCQLCLIGEGLAMDDDTLEVMQRHGAMALLVEPSELCLEE
jgi:hypothetical protein